MKAFSHRLIPTLLFSILLAGSCQQSMLTPSSESRLQYVPPQVTKSSEDVDFDEGAFLTSSISNTDSIMFDNGLVVHRMIGSDTLYVFEGDIIFGQSQLAILSNLETSLQREGNVQRGALFVANSNPTAYYWPNGIVPYKFDTSFTSSYQQNATSAMTEISDKTGITFRNALTSDANYILFKKSTGNNSSIGMVSGAQTINIVTNRKGTIMHEILHALGLYHEQTRHDRDSSIIVNYSNIKPNKRHNFNVYSQGLDLGAFDFNSIMLYSSFITDTNFVYNPTTPVMTKLDGSTFVGQRDSLSRGDINSLLTVYGTPFCNLTVQTTVLEETFIGMEETYYARVVTSLDFFNDSSYNYPTPLIYPRVVNVRKTTVSCMDGQYVYSYNDLAITCQPGKQSYVIDDRINYSIDFDGSPVQVDIVYYTLL